MNYITPSTYPSMYALFRNAPVQIDKNQISKITDILWLTKLEKEYDRFIENERDLIYYIDILEYCLEIRDALKIQLDKNIRIELLYKHYGIIE